MLFSALMALAAVTTVGPANLGPEPDGQHMTPAEIKANNAKLTRDHPYFIRCQAREETGSLVKRVRSCRTNLAWERAFQQGNQNARDSYDAMTSKASSGSN